MTKYRLNLNIDFNAEDDEEAKTYVDVLMKGIEKSDKKINWVDGNTLYKEDKELIEEW